MREEHSTFSWLLEAMIEQAGFNIAKVHCGESGTFAAYLLVKR